MLKTTLLAVTAAATLAIGATYVPSAMAGGAGCSGDTAKKDGYAKASASILDIAAGNDDFSTLAAAVTAAGLQDVLSGDDKLTVFAPTNAAFEALPEGTVEELLKPENKDQLIAILTYHVVPGEVYAKDVVKLTEATTANGKDIAIAVSDDGVMLNESAKVVKTDIKASNGVVHVINAVLLPPTETAAAE